jgi:hypothetical protein
MPRHPSPQAQAALAYINKMAHKIRKENPGMDWKTCISKASAMYRSGGKCNGCTCKC